MQLRIPGPTPCPSEVLQSMTKEMINHRDREFSSILLRLTERLKKFFQTKNDVLTLTCSGTGSMEAAVVNTLSPGDEVLAVSCGFFGERFGEMAEAYSAKVRWLRFEWGQGVDPDAVKKALESNPGIKAVLVTHNETSCGLINKLQVISKIVKGYNKLLLVDAISSLGSAELPVDEWGCDVVTTASQKGWMAPPGVAMVSVSPAAWEANSKAKMPRVYLDFAKARSFLQKGQTPWTPAVSTIFALDKALEIMDREGQEKVIARHKRVSEMARKGVKALGLSIFPKEEFASPTVTAVNAPAGLDVKKFLNLLLDKYQIALAGGQDRLEGKIFRIGHLGKVEEKDMEEVLAGIKKALPEAGHRI